MIVKRQAYAPLGYLICCPIGNQLDRAHHLNEWTLMGKLKNPLANEVSPSYLICCSIEDRH